MSRTYVSVVLDFDEPVDVRTHHGITVLEVGGVTLQTTAMPPHELAGWLRSVAYRLDCLPANCAGQRDLAELLDPHTCEVGF